MASKVTRVKTESGVKFIVGKTTLGIEVKELPESILTKLIVHGLNAKVGDSAAGAKTETEIISALKATIEQLKKGVFNAVRTGSGATMLAEAVAEMKGIDIEQASNYLSLLDDEKTKVVEGHPKIKAIVARKKAEKLAALAKAAEASEEDDEAELPEI